MWKAFFGTQGSAYQEKGFLPAYFASFWLAAFSIPQPIIFYLLSFPGLKVLAASFALCLSFSFYCQNPIFPHQNVYLCSMHIHTQLTPLFYRGADRAVIFRHGSVNRQQ